MVAHPCRTSLRSSPHHNGADDTCSSVVPTQATKKGAQQHSHPEKQMLAYEQRHVRTCHAEPEQPPQCRPYLKACSIFSRSIALIASTYTSCSGS